MKYTIELNENQEKVLLTDMISIQAWLENAIINKLRRQSDFIVEQTGKGSRMSKKAEKEKIIDDLAKQRSPLLKSAQERNKELKK